MRILAIDHGTVRIGLALSDELGMLARPLETIPAAGAIARIRQIAGERAVKIIILGLPLRLDGTEGPAAARVREFYARLRAALDDSVAILLRDESLTTVEAQEKLRARRRSAKGRNAIIDQAAAAVILQEFLDERIDRTLPTGDEPS
ncbi:MAG: Holliday junction resolvase RuvX [Verrucomicrobiales bacterium]